MRDGTIRCRTASGPRPSPCKRGRDGILRGYDLSGHRWVGCSRRELARSRLNGIAEVAGPLTDQGDNRPIVHGLRGCGATVGKVNAAPGSACGDG